MARVSVTVSQKPKPKTIFKFLKRDEGRQAVQSRPAGNQERTRSSSESTPRGVTRQSLREAIAKDILTRKSNDPFSDVVIAVPKNTPPPNSVASSSGNAGEPERRDSRSSLTVKRQEWVNVATPPNGEEVKRGPSASTEGGAPPYMTSTLPPNYDSNPPLRQREMSVGESIPGPRTQREDRMMLPRPRSGGDIREEERTYGPVGGGYGNNAGATRIPAGRRPMQYDDEYEPGSHNYFRAARPHSVGPSYRGSGGDDQIAQQLERELSAARYEREHFLEAKRQLEEERQRFEAFRRSTQEEIDYNTARLEVQKREIMRDAHRDARTIEERYKNVLTLLENEKESNRRLTQENDLLTTQLNELTTTMNESQRVHKAEIARLRRSVESLSQRNKELLAMERQHQIEELEIKTGVVNRPSHSVPALDIPTSAPSSSASLNKKADGRFASLHQRGSSLERNSYWRQAEEEMQYKERRDRGEAEGNGGLQVVEVGYSAALDAPVGSKGKAGTRRDDGLTAAEVTSERRQGGHPVTTPRVMGGGGGAGKASQAKGGRRIPTKEELLGVPEVVPPLEIHNDVIVSKNALGENPNKREVLYRSGKREIHYANGTTKIVLPSGHSVLEFVNGDVKRTFPSGRSTYWYEKAQTMHTQIADGTQLFEFYATGQTERHFPSGEKEILYPDGIYKVVHADGTDETFFPDDTR